MNIIVERSFDDDYSILSSCSSLGENLDEFLNIIYQQKKFRVIDFNPYEIFTTVNQVSQSLEAQMEEADEDVALARVKMW